MAQLAPTEVDMVIERALADLPLDEWQVIDTRQTVSSLRADFVVIGPPGVFVIGCGRRGERERARAKQLMGLLDAGHKIAEVADIRRDEVLPVLCMIGEDPEDSWTRGVTVCGVVNLADTLAFKRHRLTSDEVTGAAHSLGRVLRTGGKHRA